MRDKDINEFDKIYNQYFKAVYLFILKMSKDSNIAEEIAQETFFKAMSSIDSFKGNCKISSWLFQIAKNTYFTYLKKQERYIHKTKDYEERCTNIEESLLDKEKSFYIHKILHSIEEPYKEVFTLRVFGELSFMQIGLLFGKSENWARVTFYRAKQKIKDKMEGMQNE
ncbi:MAG: RNA polymerase sigma factor [Romboutsia sp.]|uniref:RNA polymerase sigma factor n=1 Tax=Romboutsia sp. TaxID=1965302 RepID=UPI003F37EFC1